MSKPAPFEDIGALTLRRYMSSSVNFPDPHAFDLTTGILNLASNMNDTDFVIHGTQEQEPMVRERPPPTNLNDPTEYFREKDMLIKLMDEDIAQRDLQLSLYR